MGQRRAAFAFALVIGTAGFFPAFALTDPATGFGVTPPAPFTVEAAAPASNDVAFGVNTPEASPARAGTSPYLCKIGFKRTGLNSTVDQAAINERVAGKQWRDVSRKVLERMFTITAEEPLMHGAAAGVEYQVTPKYGPNAEAVRSYIGLIETPKGRVLTSCATTATDYPKALDAFRAIQRGIALPR